MATYGYGGEFSSDEDIDKLDQLQADRLVQQKFDNTSKPSKRLIEETIESVKNLPFDQEIQLTDEILAGLLDHYRTPRGPIVDSTRKLYNKIALRLIRDDKGSDIGSTKETNGNAVSGNNVNNNNNSINIISKRSQSTAADNFSSDDDEYEIKKIGSNLKKLNHDVVYDDNEIEVIRHENVERMEIDSETPKGVARETKQIDLPTTDDDDSEEASGEESDDSDESTDSDSEAIEVTPIKPPSSTRQAIVTKERQGVEALLAARPSTPRLTESTSKRQPLAHSTPKESVETSATKKPYTRSQRVATRSATATKSKRPLDVQPSDKIASKSSKDAFIAQERAPSYRRYVFLISAIMVVLIAIAYVYFVRFLK